MLASAIVGPVTPDEQQPSVDLRNAAGVWVTLAGVAAALTVVFLGMRAVMEIGGSCAEGGPFVPVRPCPKGVPGLMIGGIWGGLIFAGLYAWQSIKAGAPSFIGFLWPALFISLGWNFLEFGINPPGGGGLAWGWLICAILFVLMGGVPLLVVLPAFFKRARGVSTPPGASAWVAHPATLRAATSVMSALRKIGDQATEVQASPAPPPGTNVVTLLERLSALHASGALDDQEYEAAKRTVLKGEGAS